MDTNISEQRTTALLGALDPSATDGKRVDAVLISALSNVRYLSGFTGSNAMLLVTRDGSTLFTDPRYEVQAREENPFPVRIGKGPLPPLVATEIKRRKWRNVAFERNRIDYATWDGVRSDLEPNQAIVPLNGVVEELRMVKSPEELALIRESIQSNSRAFRRALKTFQPGLRESQLSAEIDYQARRAGAQMPAFETIVASGPRSALPHARPTSAKVRERDILLIDMGCVQHGYCSDMTRTLHVGKASKRFKAIYNAVLEAQLAAIDAVRPGITAGSVDAAARKVLRSHGLADAFVHSTGHGLGLEIHEQPRIGKKAETRLAAGMAITIEPGAYFEDYGGIRIEDTVFVTETGCEVVTPTSKELVEL